MYVAAECYPSTFINIYGIRSPRYLYDRIFDLEDSYMNNLVMLGQNHDFTNDRTFPKDLPRQSIVHVKMGVLASGQQVKVTFHFRVSRNGQNKVQIFVNDARGQVFDCEQSVRTSYGMDWYIGNLSTIVTGDGHTSIDVYFRPAVYCIGSIFNRILFFERVDVEVL